MRYLVFSAFLLAWLEVGGLGQKEDALQFTTNSANINGIRARIDHADLDGNPDAIMLVQPETPHPHPIAVWYLANKWHVFNTDQTAMPAGVKFHVRYWTKPDAMRFVHVVTQQNLQAGVSYIDHPALNDLPQAGWSLFQSMSNARGGYWNANEAEGQYDDARRKWYVRNKNGQPVLAGNAYNVAVVTNTLPPLEKPRIKPGANPVTIIPASTPSVTPGPTAFAGGDLTGRFPDPTVRGIRGRPVSTAAPAVGDILRWNGTEWAPAAQPIPQTDAMPSSPLGGLQTHYRTGELVNWSSHVTNGSKHDLTALRIVVNAPRRSRLIISGSAGVAGPGCTLPCGFATGFLFVTVDNNANTSVTGFTNTFFTLGNLDIETPTISNYMIDVPPGSHTIDFALRHVGVGAGFKAKATFSSVIVVPID